MNFHSEFLTCLRAKAATPPVPSTLVAEDSTQGELLKGEAAVQTSDYRKCQGISLGTGTGCRSASRKCAQMRYLLSQAAEQPEAVRRLCRTKEAEKGLDSWFQMQSAVDPQPMAKQPKPLPSKLTDGRGLVIEKNFGLLWQGTASGQNLFTALQTENERPVSSGEPLELNKTAQSSYRITTKER